MNPTRLQPVLITGCSSGIGKACALRLARHGWIVYAAVRDPTHTPDLHAGGCRTVLLDVTDETSMSEAVNVIEAEHGPVGAVVHNAGTSLVGPVESLTRDALRNQFEVHVAGPLYLTQLVLPGMRAAGQGRIIVIGSMGARFSVPLLGGYTAAKAAAAVLAEVLRTEVQPFGVDVSVLEPGFVRTAFLAGATHSAATAERQTESDDPYRDAVRTYRTILQDTDRRLNTTLKPKSALPTTARLGAALLALACADPEHVAARIERTLTTKRPAPRRLVTGHARLAAITAQALTARQWDTLTRTLLTGATHLPRR
ncbi:SDR family NAD(P)-dependent oxidoreductase [Streptomyces triculaminicus]|uniref:SDR family NAD(P)-dependent oxidoreductase n=1 Tax=Streptomyces triculaminicus TaxID=2816232 RepID=A0A939FSV4_9ACTN|nr:SDR family NAD(P)-dependent oxidoreductase [Streptomyces triculaminicus]MBO0657485.1 SDR family NAD(P)-dependent oxidoreductase [Streptomyces triculaminicus]